MPSSKRLVVWKWQLFLCLCLLVIVLTSNIYKVYTNELRLQESYRNVTTRSKIQCLLHCEMDLLCREVTLTKVDSISWLCMQWGSSSHAPVGDQIANHPVNIYQRHHRADFGLRIIDWSDQSKLYPMASFQFPINYSNVTICSWFRSNASANIGPSRGLLTLYRSPLEPTGKCNHPLFLLQSGDYLRLMDDPNSKYLGKYITEPVWAHLCYVRSNTSSGSKFHAFYDGQYIVSATTNSLPYMSNANYSVILGNDADYKLVDGQRQCVIEDEQGFIGELLLTTIWDFAMDGDMIRQVYNNANYFHNRQIVRWKQFYDVVHESGHICKLFYVGNTGFP